MRRFLTVALLCGSLVGSAFAGGSSGPSNGGGSGATGANPTATAGPAAVNGSATTFLRSDGAPAIQKGSASIFGIVECDGTTITCTAGVISSSGMTTNGSNATSAALGNIATAAAATPTTFGSVQGTVDVQSGTTYTLAATDCGKTLLTTNSGAVTVTIPASIVPVSGTACVISVIQGGAAKVSVNGSAVSAATIVSAGSYTGTSGVAGAEIGLVLTTVSSTATAYLVGNGS